jgi:hypothetical protein
MGFGEGLFALRATKSAESVSMFPEALTIDIAGFASHCFHCFVGLHHMLIFYYERTLFSSADWSLCEVFSFTFQ